jgi:beta-lactam-binding protein with PASTA domain
VVIALAAAAPLTAGTSKSILVKHIAPPVRCRVPAVKNKPLAVAVRAILKRHCSVGTIGRAFSKVVKKDHVISEMPRPRTVLPNQGEVDLVISRGRKP